MYIIYPVIKRVLTILAFQFFNIICDHLYQSQEINRNSKNPTSSLGVWQLGFLVFLRYGMVRKWKALFYHLHCSSVAHITINQSLYTAQISHGPNVILLKYMSPTDINAQGARKGYLSFQALQRTRILVEWLLFLFGFLT